MKTKANKELFDAWRFLGEQIKNQASIVQNDLELTSTDLFNWDARCHKLTFQLKNLTVKTSFWLKGQ